MTGGDVGRRIHIFKSESKAAPVVLGKDGRTTTLRLFEGRPVRILELAAAVAFRAGGAVPLPAPPEPATTSALAAVAEVLRFLRGSPDQGLLVAAHGDDEARTALRARAVRAWIAGDGPGFAEAAASASIGERQQVLAWVAATFGWPCSPGKLDEQDGPRTRGALRAFRERSNADHGTALALDEPIGPADWEAVLGCYDRATARLLGVELDELAPVRAALRQATPPAVGCGPAWPSDRVRIKSHEPQDAARVDLLLFNEPDLPKLSCHTAELAAPTTCDVYRKGKYRAVPFAAEASQPAVVRALLKGLFFETDKTFLLPKAKPGMKRLKRFLESHPGQQLLVVGHADAAGAADYNLKLSVDRAENLAAYLRDDVAAWMLWYDAPIASKRWGTREDQHMLSALPPEGAPFYAGELDGIHGSGTRKAIQDFQAFSNETRGTALPLDGAASKATREALVAAYMDLDGTTLPEGTVVLTHGCGEFHPEVPTKDGVANDENRRAEVFFFPEGVAPPPRDKCPAPGCPEYPVWRLRTVLTIDLTQEGGDLGVIVVDDDDKLPLGEAAVTLTGLETRQEPTNALGAVIFPDLLPGAYEVLAEKEGKRPKKVTVEVASGQKAKLAPPEPVVAGGAPPATKLGITESAKEEAPPPTAAPTVTGPVTGTVIELADAAPTIVEFKGRPTPKPNPAAPAPKNAAPFVERIVFEQHGFLELTWTISGEFDKVVLRGGKLEDGTTFERPLTAQPQTKLPSGDVQASVIVDYDKLTPRDDDTLLLVASHEKNEATKSVSLVGIERFEVATHEDTILSSGGVLVRKGGQQVVEPVSGKNGFPFAPNDKQQVLIKPKNNPGHKVQARWLVRGAATVDVKFSVVHNNTTQFTKPSDHPLLIKKVVPPGEPEVVFGVTDLTRKATKAAPATFDVVEDAGFLFDLGIELFDAGTTKKLAASGVRIANDFADPKILDLRCIDITTGVDGVGRTELETWKELGFAWRLNDTSGKNLLRIRLIDDTSKAELTNELVKRGDDPKLKNLSGPFEKFDPKRPPPYTMTVIGELGPPKKGTNGLPLEPQSIDVVVSRVTLKLRFAPAPAVTGDLISIRTALSQPNGSLLMQSMTPPKRSLTWGPEAPTTSVAAITDPLSPSHAIWSWEQKPSSAGSVKATNVRARVRDSKFVEFKVLDEVVWSPPRITTKKGVSVTLPLDEKFFVERYLLSDGLKLSTSGFNHAWKMGCHYDSSFLLVFAYEINDAGAFTPLDPTTIKGEIGDRLLLPKCPAPFPAGALHRGNANPVKDTEPLRVFVCASLVCNREKSDFEPGGVLGAGRLYAHLMVLPNKDLQDVRGTVTYVRPSGTTVTSPGLDGATKCPCDEMAAEIAPICFTDTNHARILEISDPAVPLPGVGKLRGTSVERLIGVLPAWNNFFDYYDTSMNLPDSFIGIGNGSGTTTTSPAPNVKVLLFPKVTVTILPPPLPPLVSIADEEVYKPMPVRKLPRQGEFDSVHMAPKMFIDLGIRAAMAAAGKFKNPPISKMTPLGGWKDWGLDEIGMAPFCVHDCFHTHWRWSEFFTPIQSLGYDQWDASTKAGSPLIPPNQTLDISLPNKRTLVYAAAAMTQCEGGRWQVFFTHGSAYALAVADPATVGFGQTMQDAGLAFPFGEPKVGKPGLTDLPLLCVNSWALFYWRLRFGGTKDQPRERLLFDRTELTGFRKHGL